MKSFSVFLASVFALGVTSNVSASVNTTVSTCINVTGELKITNAALKISDTLTAAGYVIVNHK